jgi:nicotinamide-nucleotide adenylyltransferase
MKQGNKQGFKQALFVGRFQPFHLGHLSVIKKALETEDRLVIVIGSAEENHEAANPFTAGERFQMIEACLSAEGISGDRYAIIPIRNVENFMLWTTHVDQYIPPVYKVYTGSDIVKALYTAYGKYEIEDVEFVSNVVVSGAGGARVVKRNTVGQVGTVSGTVIREKMAKGDDEWKQLVHPSVVALIEGWNGVQRVKMVS